MKRSLVRLTLAAFVASTALASAQHAVPRGGGGGGGSSPSGPSGGSSGGSSGSDSGGGGVSGFSGGDGGGRAAPRHPTTTSGSSGGYRGGDGSASGRARGPNGGGSYAGSNEGAPNTSRPGDGRPVTGYAVPRGTGAVPPGRPGGDYYYYPRGYNWFYNPWGYGAWGLGYIWDPYWFGMPPAYGGYGYPGYGYGGYGYGGGYGGGGYGADAGGDTTTGGGYAGEYRRDDQGEGSLRIKVKPREAKVSVDGFVSGTVDDFDGKFQKLTLPAGPHKVTLDLDGYQPLTFDVMIADGQTVNYKGQMRKH